MATGHAAGLAAAAAFYVPALRATGGDFPAPLDDGVDAREGGIGEGDVAVGGPADGGIDSVFFPFGIRQPCRIREVRLSHRRDARHSLHCLNRILTGGRFAR